MSEEATHIIHKLNLDIEVPGERLARHIYAQAGTWIQQYVLPKLEELLKQYEGEDRYIRLKTLDIDLDMVAGDSPEETIKQQLAIAIGKQLDMAIRSEEQDTVTGNNGRKEHKGNKDNLTISTGAQQVVDAFFYFLESGALPWWLADTEVLSESAGLIDAITQQEERFVALFLAQVKEKPVLLERMLLQYDAVWLTYCYSLIAPLELFSLVLSEEQHLPEAFVKQQNTGKKQYWFIVWQLYPVAALATIGSEAFRRRLQEEIAILVGDNLPGAKAQRHTSIIIREDEHSQTTSMVQEIKDKDKVAGEEKDREQKGEAMDRKQWEAIKDIPGQIDEGKETGTKDLERQDGAKGMPGQIKEGKETEESIAANDLPMTNAGLILLHPFLQYFFLELGLLEGTQFRDKKAKDTAIHLLHYLATGRTQAPDFDLVFEKYLCGTTAVHITDRYVVLSDAMKAEAGTLLASVIKHWQVLKNTSAAGLQEGFLQRKGKLIIKEANHRLLMEQNALDILLGQIPWNISLVKLPWKEGLLHVEWAT